jgi:hypothetical protein
MKSCGLNFFGKIGHYKSSEIERFFGVAAAPWSHIQPKRDLSENSTWSIIRTSQMKIKNGEWTKPASGYSDSESDRLITVAGQRRTCTELSP